MHPRVREVLDYLVTAKMHLRDAVDSVPAALRETRPEPDRWSVGDVIEHLALVNGNIARLIVKRVGKAREAGTLGPEREISSVIWSLDVARVLDRRDLQAAPESARPTQVLTADAAWQALENAHVAVHDAIIAADGLAVGTIEHTHSFMGPLNLYQWVAFAAAHEFRHAAQIREIAGSLQAKAGSM